MAEKKTVAKNTDKTAEKAPETPSKVVIDYEGTKYTIEYNRAALRVLEDNYDFNIEDLQKGKLSKLPDLFYVGFAMHHPNMKRSTSDAIYDRIGDKEGLLAVLVQLYTVALTSLFAEPDEGKAVSWKAL